MIRHYSLKDLDKLKNLVHMTKNDGTIIDMLEQPNNYVAYVYYEQEELVGCMVAWKSSFHPFCTYFQTIIHPDFLPATGELITVLEDTLNIQDYPLLTKVEEGTALADYYQKKHFEIIRKTYLPSMNIDNYSKLLLPVETNERIKSMDEVQQNSELVNQLVKLVKTNYVETHLVNPVADFDLATWRNLLFQEDLILNGSYVYLNENKKRVIAYSMLHESEQSDTVELGWIGTSKKSEIGLLHQLIALQINDAKENNYHHLEGEFDTTDPYAMAVFHHFPFPTDNVLLTFAKKTKG